MQSVAVRRWAGNSFVAQRLGRNTPGGWPRGQQGDQHGLQERPREDLVRQAVGIPYLAPEGMIERITQAESRDAYRCAQGQTAS